jgi:hypothetical protein
MVVLARFGNRWSSEWRCPRKRKLDTGLQWFVVEIRMAGRVD